MFNAMSPSSGEKIASVQDNIYARLSAVAVKFRVYKLHLRFFDKGEVFSLGSLRTSVNDCLV